MSPQTAARHVVIVTGAGAGIGAAIATELGTRGAHVVAVDPLVSVDGTAPATPHDANAIGTVESIRAAGGSAESCGASVTDARAMEELVADLLARHGRLDALVNAAGISRPTGFATGDEDAWDAVLAVHLSGYLNVLAAALGHFASVGAGRVLAMTSGSGWRDADAGAYGCAKRAVASLTWQIGRAVPAGVSVGAISPIALTRMVTAAMGGAAPRAPDTARPGATGGLALGGLPPPEHLGPLGAHLAGPHGPGLGGKILFAGGTEVALVAEPRLIEVVRTSGVESAAAVVEAFLPTLVAAESHQRTGGGANPRFASFPAAATAASPSGAGAVAVVSDRTDVAATLAAALGTDGTRSVVMSPETVAHGLDGARRALLEADRNGDLRGVVTAFAGGDADAGNSWQAILASHAGVERSVMEDARWARACAEHSATHGRPLALVHLVDAVGAGGKTRAQVAAQLSRASLKATGGLVASHAVSLETDRVGPDVCALVGALVNNDTARALSGAELVAGPGWLGLRCHPAPAGSVVFAEPLVPAWFDSVLAEMLR